MNRTPPIILPRFERFPHLCGDEPAGNVERLIELCDFPTYVGMNHKFPILRPLEIRFPHLCGDEPVIKKAIKKVIKISPPMWG